MRPHSRQTTKNFWNSYRIPRLANRNASNPQHITGTQKGGMVAMEAGFFEKQIVPDPGSLRMPGGAFAAGRGVYFQGIASEHAERIVLVARPISGKSGANSGLPSTAGGFLRVAYLGRADSPHDAAMRGRIFRCFRNTLVYEGRQRPSRWAGRSGPFSARSRRSCALRRPASRRTSPFRTQPPLPQLPVRFHDELTQDELIYTHLVRATDIDMGVHIQRRLYPPPARMACLEGSLPPQDQKH